MVKFMVVLSRRASMTPDRFRQYFKEVHEPMALQIPGLRKYVQNFAMDDSKRNRPPWDAIIELYFDDWPSMERPNRQSPPESFPRAHEKSWNFGPPNSVPSTDTVAERSNERRTTMGGDIIGLVAVIMSLGIPIAAMYTYYRVRKLRTDERMAALARGVDVPMQPDLSEAARSRRSGILLVTGGIGFFLDWALIRRDLKTSS
jgi:uncharacterized protein (TIGR02118 family)